MPLENFETLLLKLGETMDLPNLQADENGDCELIFDDQTKIHVQWEPLEDCIVFSSDIGVVPQETGRLAILEKLLSANLFWIETGGCTFAFERGSGLIVLQNRARLESLTYDSFSKMLEMFLESTEKWTKELATDIEIASTGAPLPADAPTAADLGTEELAPEVLPGGLIVHDDVAEEAAAPEPGESSDSADGLGLPPGGLQRLV